MRKAVERQRRLDCPSIVQVRLNLNCRTEIIPVLRALQYIYSQPNVRDPILRIIGRDVNKESSAKCGRRGLSYWEILVLAAVRLGCNLDYDALQNLAEEHRSLRLVMGIGDWEEEPQFDWRRIQDNVTLLRPETIEKINAILVQEGHRLNPEAAQTVRADSFVAETNIHYPTDSSLIRDGVRKILGLGAALSRLLGVEGWRQHRHLRRKAKMLAREIDRIAGRKTNGYKERLKPLYRDLLALADTICGRAEELREESRKSGGGMLEVMAMDRDLEAYLQRTRQVCGVARRRVLCDEKIENHEKLFSMFEPHTQLFKRGKAGQEIQLGRLVLIFEDGAGFISYYTVLPREQGDKDVVVAETRKAQKRHGGRIRRASFDRGFHSPTNQEELAKIVAAPCLPKPGAIQAAEQEQAASVEFRQARQSHPGVESAIGALQSGNGLVRCRDRSEQGFERYIGLGVLGRNLHVLGKLLIAQEASNCAACATRRKRAA